MATSLSSVVAAVNAAPKDELVALFRSLPQETVEKLREALTLSAGPLCVNLVAVEVNPDRLQNFFEILENDVKRSRTVDYDSGCIRFDLLRDRENPNKFFFFEAFIDNDGAEFHKTTSHYKSWKEFKESGGILSQEVVKLETASIGSWAFQTVELGRAPVGSGVFVTVEIEPNCVKDFLTAMSEDVQKSRCNQLDPGCMRFDLLRSRDDPNKFVFYEAYVDDDAAAFHKTTNHYNCWADFKKAGGVVSQSVAKVESASIPGAWAFQCVPCGPPVVTLGAGSMPIVGFGTYKVGVIPASAAPVETDKPPPSGPDVCEQVVRDALSSGYSMLDCAQFYMNEAWVGNAWTKTGCARENLYFISKVWNDVIYNGANAVKAQVDKSILDLQCTYIDLVLIHWPVPGKHVEAYNALRECKREGKIKEIGVSNYCIEDIEELKVAGCFGEGDADKPTLNQIEVNPLLFRKKTLEYFKQQGIHIQSYRGLLQGTKGWQNEVLQDVCKETGKSPAQVLGRFLVQQGISHVPKASTRERMKQNRDIFSFGLTDEQIERLSNLTTDCALETFKKHYTTGIWRDTPHAGDALPSERTTA